VVIREAVCRSGAILVCLPHPLLSRAPALKAAADA
jgi:hypothetical protein